MLFKTCSTATLDELFLDTNANGAAEVCDAAAETDTMQPSQQGKGILRLTFPFEKDLRIFSVESTKNLLRLVELLFGLLNSNTDALQGNFRIGLVQYAGCIFPVAVVLDLLAAVLQLTEAHCC